MTDTAIIAIDATAFGLLLLSYFLLFSKTVCDRIRLFVLTGSPRKTGTNQGGSQRGTNTPHGEGDLFADESLYDVDDESLKGMIPLQPRSSSLTDSSTSLTSIALGDGDLNFGSSSSEGFSVGTEPINDTLSFDEDHTVDAINSKPSFPASFPPALVNCIEGTRLSQIVSNAIQTSAPSSTPPTSRMYIWVFLRTMLVSAWFSFTLWVVPFISGRVLKENSDNNPQPIVLPALLMLTIQSAPATLLLFSPKAPKYHLDFIFDVLAVLTIWFPVEFGWLPSNPVEMGVDANIEFSEFAVLIGAMSLYLAALPPPYPNKIGMSFVMPPYLRNIAIAIAATVGVTLTVLPIGLATKFIEFQVAHRDVSEYFVGLFGIYFFIAIVEEFLFRGVIQKMIEHRLDLLLPSWAQTKNSSTPKPETFKEKAKQFLLPSGNAWIALIIASLIFGASHLDNSTRGNPVPNWMYAFEAFLAGLLYGWAWRTTEHITVSAITHCLVDYIWFCLFN